MPRDALRVARHLKLSAARKRSAWTRSHASGPARRASCSSAPQRREDGLRGRRVQVACASAAARADGDAQVRQRRARLQHAARELVALKAPAAREQRVPRDARVAHDDDLARDPHARCAIAAQAAERSQYEPRLYASCRSIVRHEEDARDAVQNAMTKALVALRRDTSALNVQAWLFRIAHDESITPLRRRPTSELPEAFCDRALDPSGDVLVREELRATLDGVRALPGRLQQPLLLRELAGMSYGQVAAVTGGTPASARKAVFEARSALSADRAGRDETCAAIREALSDGDGRRRRARIVRGHLRACAGCRS